AIADMRAFLEKKIIQMLKQNGGRINFAERYQQMVDRYNSGATATEQLFDELQKFTKGLKEEDQRHIREGLTEDELEIYDLLLMICVPFLKRKSFKCLSKMVVVLTLQNVISRWLIVITLVLRRLSNCLTNFRNLQKVLKKKINVISEKV